MLNKLVGYYTGPMMMCQGDGLHTVMYEAPVIVAEAGPDSLWIVPINEPVLMIGLKDHFRQVHHSKMIHIYQAVQPAVALIPRHTAPWFEPKEGAGT